MRSNLHGKELTQAQNGCGFQRPSSFGGAPGLQILSPNVGALMIRIGFCGVPLKGLL